jgi:hypothetical protein
MFQNRDHSAGPCGSSLARMFDCGLKGPHLIPGNESSFLITMSVKASETVKCHLFFVPMCLYNFLFLYWHSRTKGEQLVSQCERMVSSV